MNKKIMTFVCGLLFSSGSYAQLAVFDAASYGQLISEVTLLDQQLTQVTKSLDALKSLGEFNWSNNEMLSLMNDLNNTMRQYSHIAYSASNLDQQFKTYYPGYTSTENYQQQYKDNVNDTINTINGALQTIGMNVNGFGSESARLDTIHSHVQSAKGQTQAIQAMTEVSEELVTQTQSLRQIVSAQANSEGAYYAQQVQKEATSKANLDAVIAAGSTEDVVYGSNSEDILHSPY